MNHLKTDIVYNSAVRGKSEVIFSATAEEINELNRALFVIDKYKNMAINKAGQSMDGDWQMTKFLVNNEVKVIIECGSCG